MPVVLEIRLDGLVDQHIGIDKEKFFDSWLPGEILLVAEENSRILVIRELFVGKQLGKLAGFIEVIHVTMMLDSEVETVAAIAE